MRYVVTNRFQFHHVFNATGTTRFSHTEVLRLSSLLHDNPHWLDVPERIQFKLGDTVHRQTALAWAGAVQALCNGPPMSAAQGTTVHDRLLRLHLRHRSLAPKVRWLPSAACAATPPFDRAFSVAGPVAWNSLTDYLGDPTRSVDSFRRDLNTFLFSFY